MTVKSAVMVCNFCGRTEEFKDLLREPATYAHGVIQLQGHTLPGKQRTVEVSACPTCAAKDPILPFLEPTPRLAVAGELPDNLPDFSALRNGQ